MSNDSSFSKSQLDLLKQMKKQITTTQVQEQIKKVQQAAAKVEDDLEDEMALFHKQMQGVQKIEASNRAKIEKPKKKKDRCPNFSKTCISHGSNGNRRHYYV